MDLVYLDPPFNSNATYNVLFAEQDGTQAAAQIEAFEDTWRWHQAAAAAYEDVVSAGGKVSDAMQAFHTLLGRTAQHPDQRSVPRVLHVEGRRCTRRRDRGLPLRGSHEDHQDA